MSTRAIQYLKNKDIHFEIKTYEHQRKGAVFAASAIGFPLERTIKTLVVDLGDKGHMLVLMPGGERLAVKQLAKILSVKKISMADTASAERLTGYSVGGISPFGTRQNLPAIIETGLMIFDTVAINGGRRGTMLIMSPADIVQVLQCEVKALV